MAEDTQEDLSMEDILSSIKDILLEDNAAQQTDKSEPQTQAAAETVEPVAVKAEEVVDDVLTLSPAMIVDDAKALPEAEPIEAPELLESEALDFEHELEDMSSEHLLDDIEDKLELPNLDNNTAETEVETDKPENFTIADTEAFSIKDGDETEEVSLPEMDFAEEVDTNSEPIYSSEDDDFSKEQGFSVSDEETEKPELENTLIDDDTLNAILDGQPADPIVAQQVEEEFVEPTDNVYEAAVEIQAQEPEVQEVEVQEAEFEEIAAEPVIEEKPVETIAIEEQKTENLDANEDEAVDLSASIISNFAKMFADNQAEKTSAISHQDTKEKLASQAMEKIDLGNGSKTIEAIVRDVVAEIVEKNLEKDFDFAKTASDEIAKQTKIWLSNNLPKIVEATVQKEIERVMAKVGS